MNAKLSNVYLLSHYSKDYTDKAGNPRTYQRAEIYSPGSSAVTVPVDSSVKLSGLPDDMLLCDIDLDIRSYDGKPSVYISGITPLNKAH